MKTIRNVSFLLSVVLILLLGYSCNNSEKSGTGDNASFIDLSQARPQIEALDIKFSDDFRNRDSVALANYYASDGSLGSVKGKDNLVSAFGRKIRNAAENGTPDMLFVTNSFASDDKYVVELGIYQFADEEGNIKNQGKYLVVWKQEGGEWKIYRDNGL